MEGDPVTFTLGLPEGWDWAVSDDGEELGFEFWKPGDGSRWSLVRYPDRSLLLNSPIIEPVIQGEVGFDAEISHTGELGEWRTRVGREWWYDSVHPSVRSDLRKILPIAVEHLSSIAGQLEHEFIPEPGTEGAAIGPVMCRYCGMPAEGTVYWACSPVMTEQAIEFRVRRRVLAGALYGIVYAGQVLDDADPDMFGNYLMDALEIIETHHHLLPLAAQPESWKS